MSAPKILVSCPTSDKKSYCDTDWFDMVRSLKYPEYDVFLADNSSGLEYLKNIQSEGFKATHIRNTNKPFVKLLADSHEACREYALRHGYDYLLHLESDVFPTIPTIIHRMLKHRLPVVCAPYHIASGPASRLAIQVEEPMQLLGEYHFMNHSLSEGSDLLFIDGTLKPITASGLGCCLIHRSVLEKIQFRCVPGMDAYPDTFFFLDLFRLGIQPYMDTSLICRHRNQDSTDFLKVMNPR